MSALAVLQNESLPLKGQTEAYVDGACAEALSMSPPLRAAPIASGFFVRFRTFEGSTARRCRQRAQAVVVDQLGTRLIDRSVKYDFVAVDYEIRGNRRLDHALSVPYQAGAIEELSAGRARTVTADGDS